MQPARPLHDFFRQLTRDPVSLGNREKWLSALACLGAILLTGKLTQIIALDSATILIGSMGASAVILFVIPGSPLAQPWPFFGGHLLSGLIGISVAARLDDPTWAAAAAMGLSVLGMLLLRCLHPPGAATALIPVLSERPTDYDFLLTPLGLNVGVMLFLTLIINRLLLRRAYPTHSALLGAHSPARPPKPNLVGISTADVEQATRDFQQFIDIGTDDLCQIFTRLQMIHFQKNQGVIRCEQIMQREIVTVEYATEVETAWQLMHERQLKVLPVLDRTRRVIGIVTRYDFLKNLKLTPYEGFQDKWLTFIKRTTATTTNKPEAVGHIMTRKVRTLRHDAPIAELIPLVVSEGHHHVPIVDDENRFVGLVFQSNLVAALFNQQALPQPAGAGRLDQ